MIILYPVCSTCKVGWSVEMREKMLWPRCPNCHRRGEIHGFKVIEE